MTVEFVFGIDQKILTPLGKLGIVSMCALDEAGQKTYYVKTESSDAWFAERLLKAIE